MRDDIFQHLDLAGLGINRDHRRVAPARERKRAFRVEALEHLQPFVRYHVGRRHASRRGAAHADHAFFEDEVRHIRFQHFARALENALAHRRRRLRRRAADLHRATTARGQERERHVLRVGRRDANLVEGPTQPFGGDERDHRLVALPLRSGADIHVGGAVLGDMNLRRFAPPEPGRLDAARNSDSNQPAICLSGARRIWPKFFECHLEQPGVVAAVVDDSAPARGDAGRVRDLPRLDHVAAPQFGRRDPERERQPVHDALNRIVAERPAAAANESARHRVRVHQLVLHVHSRHHVRRDHVGDDDPGLARSRAGISADIVDQPPAQAAQLAARVCCQLDFDHRPMSLSGGRAVLAAGSNPAHRALQTPGGKRCENLLREDAAFSAEPAADVLGEHPDLRLVNTQGRRHGAFDPENVLGRRPHLDAARFRVGTGCDRARLHGGALDPSGGQAYFRRHAVRRESRLDVAVGCRSCLRDIGFHVGVDRGRAGRDGRHDIAHPQQRFQLG